ncbi:MAG: phage antirepressor N-terminal domain-containing protein [Hyphomicrobium sp.]|jgi:hypothetical protein
MENATLTPVTFHDEIVELVDFVGQPFVAVKRITANLGLSWQPQHRKLMEKFGSVVTEMMTTGADGKQYLMVCLPIRKLAAWLNTIQVNKLAPNLRAKVLRYQNECDDVLWDYWTKGMAVNPRLVQVDLTMNESIALSKECSRLLKDVSECTNPTLAGELYKHLKRMTLALGDTVAPLVLLAQGLRQGALTLES